MAHNWVTYRIAFTLWYLPVPQILTGKVYSRSFQEECFFSGNSYEQFCSCHKVDPVLFERFQKACQDLVLSLGFGSRYVMFWRVDWMIMAFLFESPFYYFIID